MIITKRIFGFLNSCNINENKIYNLLCIIEYVCGLFVP